MYKTGTKPTTNNASSIRPVGKTMATSTSASIANKENGKNNKDDTAVCFSLMNQQFIFLAHSIWSFLALFSR